MGEILEYIQQLWEPLGYSGITTVLATIVASLGVISFLWNLAGKLQQIRQQREMLKDLHPFYTPEEIQRATQYYIETTCQNIAPSKEDEPGQTHAFATRQKIIPFFLKAAFKSNIKGRQFYIVLADSGMGKTTFLINLYLRYIKQFFGTDYQIKLFPLGFPNIDKEIEKIPDKEKHDTILLLDAFDEDINAVHNYKKRLDELIQKVLHFRKVVITCRTQFFPSKEEEPEETGVLRFGGEGGDVIFYKLYLSPFDEKDIQTYLKARFPLFQRAKKLKAQHIVMSCPNLMVRPMLLSYIDDLLQSQQTYTATYRIYDELVKKWIEREARKVPPNGREHYREELFQFSREIAVDLYCHRVERQGRLLISGEEIQPFANNHAINLSEMEMKSKSLLNRNAEGEYKFSHKSVLEYFLAKEAFSHPSFRQELNFEGMDQAEAFFDEMVWEKLTVPFFTQDNPSGEYRVKDGKIRVLTRLSEKLLTEIIYLKLDEWKEADAVLLFRGLKKLKWLDLGSKVTVVQHQEFKQIVPTCQVFRYVSECAVKQVFGLDDAMKPLTYRENTYEDNGAVVIDHATGLMWQKSGSEVPIDYTRAQMYVEGLNDQKFAGHDDWRLPTIPELMSLLESEKQSNELYINSIFDREQDICWSADRLPPESSSSGAAWYVYFKVGGVSRHALNNSDYVRAVRS